MRGVTKQTSTAAAGSVTVGDLLDAYETAARARGVGETQFVCVRHLRGFLGTFAVDDLTPEAVLRYRAARKVADGTVRRELATLTAALKWAVKHRKIREAPAVDLPPAGTARAVFLDEATECDLFRLAAADVNGSGRLSRIGLFVCIALDTGARKSAVLGLTWDRVDLARGTADFRDPAMRVTKKRRVATPVTTRLGPVLARAWAERTGNGFVLGNDGDLRKSWAGFMARHGFVDVTPHVLRHTRITLLLRAGVSIWDVGALVGASTDVIEEVYGHHVSDNRLRDQANRRAAVA